MAVVIKQGAGLLGLGHILDPNKSYLSFDFTTSNLRKEALLSIHALTYLTLSLLITEALPCTCCTFYWGFYLQLSAPQFHNNTDTGHVAAAALLFPSRAGVCVNMRGL